MEFGISPTWKRLTGSLATGSKVGAMAAAAFVPAFLELGGKDPAIILPGADPPKRV